MKEILAKWMLSICAGIIAFITPITGALYFVGVLVMADFVSGVLKAHKSGTISSRRMIDKFYVSVGYFIGICLSQYVEIYFGDAVPIVKAVVAIIAITEIQSVRENITIMTGTDILKPLIKILERKSDAEN